MEGNWAIACDGLGRRYNGEFAVRDCDMKIGRGDFYILCGDEGSGKTTLVRLLMGMIRPCEGGFTILGADMKKDGARIKRRLGYVPEEILYFENMSAGFFIRSNPFFRKERDQEELLRLSQLFELDLDTKLLHMTYEENKKAAVINALAAGPELLILDEPDFVLGERAQRVLYGELQRRSREGTAVLLTCGDAETARNYASRAAFLEDGRIVREVDLKQDIPQEKILTVTGGKKDIFEIIGARLLFQEGSRAVFAFNGDKNALKRALLLSDCEDYQVEDALFEEQMLGDYGRWQLDDVDIQTGV